MRVSLKAKLTAVISFLVLLVVLVTSSLYVSSLTQHVLRGIEELGLHIAHTTFAQAAGALATTHLPPGTDPTDLQKVREFVRKMLAQDEGLATELQSAVGYNFNIYYVMIT